MSTLEVSNLNDGTTTLATTFVTNGSAKTWCQWSGASVIRDSLNVSSIADIATGSNTLTYTTNFANDDYAGGGLARENSSGGAAFMRLSTFSSSNTRYFCVDESATSTDGETQMAVLHGDLA
tara:strand:+ start:314 stop:679 length:366 start_codon:yes stop_codon:yes gene_type:complete